VRALIIIAVEKPLSLCAMLIEEAYASDSAGVDPLLRSRDDRKLSEL
jgi:hypothetical protein